MQVLKVGGPQSKLFGARCRHCRRPLETGEVVLHQSLALSDAGVSAGYGERRFVVHVTPCITDLVATAPKGRMPRSARGQFLAIQEALAAGADVFADL